jgi:hypothetical protein
MRTKLETIMYYKFGLKDKIKKKIKIIQKVQ